MSEEQITNQTLPINLEASVKLIEPKGNLLGFAQLKFNDCFVVEGFKVLQSEDGLFIGMPSRQDSKSQSGYRDIAKPITAEFRVELQETVIAAYHEAVEKLQARTAAVVAPEKESITKQLAKGAEQAAKDNAAKPAPAKGKAKNEAR